MQWTRLRRPPGLLMDCWPKRINTVELRIHTAMRELLSYEV